MSVTTLSELLSKSPNGDAFGRPLLSVWPHIDSILRAFSTATSLPIFVFFNDALLFRTPPETMPPFCQRMLDSPETAPLCMKDGQRRAAGDVPEVKEGVQMCHAGMLNGRREIETGIGTLVILFGSKKSITDEAGRRRARVVQRVAEQAQDHAAELDAADRASDPGDFEPADMALINSITDIIERLISATAGFHFQTFNMAHELSLMLISVGFHSEDLNELVAGLKGGALTAETKAQMSESNKLIFTQCRLGLYIVRNFLSHANETKYREVVKPHFVEVNMEDLLQEMVELHRPLAAEKKIKIEVVEEKEKEKEPVALPAVLGNAMELRRLFYNVISNAIKYSYHSIPNARRVIRIRRKVPYDPGFKKERFAVAVENYGLGLTEEERRSVFRAGFRVRQAVEEVPIGSGIGLSEATKIMQLHKGEIRLHSKSLHEPGVEQGPYLTTVDLIFPYVPRRSRRT